MIPYGRQDINQADIDAVVEVLRSDYLTQGECVPAFENAIATYCGAQHAVAVNSATSALHIACLALGVGKGDRVWTVPTSFVASANCALYCGAVVDFVDIDPHTYNISIERLSEKLEQASKTDQLPKVVIPVHLCGQPCDLAAINELAQRYKFKIIEDASHAIGAKYQNEAIGNCRYSDIAVFSFHPVKIITTGEGGMVVTNNSILAEQLRRLRSHGITSNANEMQSRPADEIWNYQQISLGFNYRMTDIHAALGLSQMNRLDAFVEKRHSIARNYDERLECLPLRVPYQHSDTYSSYHLYPIRLKYNELEKTQRQIFDELRSGNVLANLHYIPIYRQPFYEAMGFREGYCSEAERYYKEAISLPIYPSMTEDQQEYVITLLKEVLKK